MLFWNAQGQIRLGPLPEPVTIMVERASDRRLPSSLALHEAAHVLGCAAFGVTVAEVAVVPPPNEPTWNGYTRHRRPQDPWVECVIALIGQASDRVFYKREPDQSCSDYTAGRRAACEIVHAEGGDAFNLNSAQFRLVLAEGHSCGSELIRKNEIAVKRLAAALDQRKELSGRAAIRILGQSSLRPHVRTIWRHVVDATPRLSGSCLSGPRASRRPG
jgi:hypothetical protein